MMGSKPAKAMRVKTLQSHWAIGDPDALPIEIHLAGCGATDSFLRSSAGEERPMKHCQFQMPGWVWNCDRE